jgi:hypothetical protein
LGQDLKPHEAEAVQRGNPAFLQTAPRGKTAEEIAEQLGCSVTHAHNVCEWAVREGRAMRVDTARGVKYRKP